MSRTNRGEKGSGYEYWSRRSKGLGWYTKPGRKAKKFTTKISRAKIRPISQAIAFYNHADGTWGDLMKFCDDIDSREAM